jgi:DNA-binding HxlR family transcriptional regulator
MDEIAIEFDEHLSHSIPELSERMLDRCQQTLRQLEKGFIHIRQRYRTPG